MKLQAGLLDVEGRWVGRSFGSPNIGPEAPSQVLTPAPLRNFAWRAARMKDPSTGRRLLGRCPAGPGVCGPGFARPGPGTHRSLTQVVKQKGGSWVISFANHRSPVLLLPLPPSPLYRPARRRYQASLTHLELLAALYGKTIRVHHSPIYLQRPCGASGNMHGQLNTPT